MYQTTHSIPKHSVGDSPGWEGGAKRKRKKAMKGRDQMEMGEPKGREGPNGNGKTEGEGRAKR